MNSVLKDMQEMVDILRAHGYPGNNYEMHAPVNYAKAVHAELHMRGIEINYPREGDEMYLELQNRGKLTIYVH